MMFCWVNFKRCDGSVCSCVCHLLSSAKKRGFKCRGFPITEHSSKGGDRLLDLANSVKMSDAVPKQSLVIDMFQSLNVYWRLAKPSACKSAWLMETEKRWHIHLHGQYMGETAIEKPRQNQFSLQLQRMDLLARSGPCPPRLSPSSSDSFCF